MPPNTQEQLNRLEQKMRELEAELLTFKRPDRLYFKENIEFPTDIGVRFGTDPNQKMAFYNEAPTAQFNTTGESVGHVGMGGVAVTHTDVWGGGTGTGKLYTINDIVKALKNYGLLDQ